MTLSTLPPTRRRQPFSWWPYVVLASVVAIVYLPTLHYNFTYFDDDRLILERLLFLRDWRHAGAVFQQDVFHSWGANLPYYRPVLTLSFMVDASWGGAQAWPYHLTNLLLHAAVVGLLFQVLLKLGHRRVPAFMAAAAFAGHPLLTVAVAWVPGRNDLLLALFSLVAFLALLYYLDSRRAGALLLHLLSVAAALLTKETAVVLPVLLGAYAWHRQGAAQRRAVSGLVLPGGYVAVLAAWWAARLSAFSQGLPGVQAAEGPALGRLVTRVPELLSSFGEVFWPGALNVFATEHTAELLVGWAAAAALTLVLLMSRERRAPLVWLGLSWFLLPQLPALAAPVAPFTLPHRLTLPLVGLLLVILEIDWVKRLSLPTLPGVAAAIAVITLAQLSRQQLPAFADRVTFWEQAVAVAPQASFARANLGRVYLLEGRLADSERENLATLALNPWQYAAHNNLGVIAERRGALDEAAAHYRQELAAHLYDHALFNLGNLAFKQGQPERAAWFWRRTIELNPEYLNAYVNLAAYHQRRGDGAAAQRYLGEFTQRGGTLE